MHFRAATGADDRLKLATLVIVDGKITEVEAFAFGSS